MENNRFNFAVFISGDGSNLQSIINKVHFGNNPANISCVISNNPDAYGLIRAKKASIPTHIVNHSGYTSRREFEIELINILKTYKLDLIVLAGFMRILEKFFINYYKDKILNIHPSLLPNYPGLNTHRRVLDSGDTTHGCSIHLVTTELDQGPLIMQAIVPVFKTDNLNQLAKRVLKKEHIIYPLTIKWIAENKLAIRSGKIYYRGAVINKPLLLTRELEKELQ